MSEVHIDHTKQSLIESMHLKEEDYKTVMDCIGTLHESKPLPDMITDLESKKIEKVNYYVSIYTFTMMQTAAQKSFAKFATNAIDTEKTTDEQDIRDALSILLGFVQNNDVTSDVTKISMLLIPIIVMAATKIIPLSLCIETLVQALEFNNISLTDIFKGTAALGEFIDPILFKGVMEQGEH